MAKSDASRLFSLVSVRSVFERDCLPGSLSRETFLLVANLKNLATWTFVFRFHRNEKFELQNIPKYLKAKQQGFVSGQKHKKSYFINILSLDDA